MRRRLLISLAGVVATAILISLGWSGPAQHGNAAAVDMEVRLDPSIIDKVDLGPNKVI